MTTAPIFMEKKDEHFENNFDFLRFLAATFVIISHSFALTLNQTDPLGNFTGFMTMGSLGVAIFFTISGYLILKSWDRKREPISFFKNRILRIFPGLTCVVLITVFVIGPLVTILSWKNYFLNTETWVYFNNIILNIQFSLPGVFVNNPYPNSVNGSLWTLPIEFCCYILVFILGLFLVYRNRYNLIIIFAIQSLIFLAFPLQLQKISPPFFPFTNAYQIVLLTLFFSAGMIFYAFKDLIKPDFKISVILFFIFMSTFLFAKVALANFMMIIFVSYLTMVIAFLPLPHLHLFGKNGDFSYGLYIYAFPIQQTLVFCFKGLSILSLFISSFLCTLFIAILSWNFIENPCLKLKNKAFSTLLKRGQK